MRREFVLHFLFWFAFFVFITLVRQYFNILYWPFWVGGMLGIFLPDIDHLIYIYFTKPQELTSQRVGYLVDKKNIKRSIELLYETRSERKGLIFHTVFFQLIFLILTFWMVSSSGSFFGKGLVLSFSIHLLVDQIVDLTELENFDNWLMSSPITLDFEKAKIYWLIVLIIVCVIAFLF